MSLSKTTKSYSSYRSVGGGGGGGNADLNIEYSHDLSALSRLEVRRESDVCVCVFYLENSHTENNTNILRYELLTGPLNGNINALRPHETKKIRRDSSG